MKRVVTTSFARQRLWFLDQMEPGTPAYNLPRVSRISGPLEIDALARAIQTLADRHESLRTVCAEDARQAFDLTQGPLWRASPKSFKT
jgi:hypothetical protein